MSFPQRMMYRIFFHSFWGDISRFLTHDFPRWKGITNSWKVENPNDTPALVKLPRYHSFIGSQDSHIWQTCCGELDVGKDSLHHVDVYIYIYIQAILSLFYLLMFCFSQVCSGCYLAFCTWRCVEFTLKGPSYPTYTEDPYNSPFERRNTSCIPSKPFMALTCLWSKLKPEPCGENSMHSFKHVPNCFGTDRGSFWRYQWGEGPLRCNWAILHLFFLPEIRHQTPDEAFFALNFVIYHRFGHLFFSSKILYLAIRFYMSSDRDPWTIGVSHNGL